MKTRHRVAINGEVDHLTILGASASSWLSSTLWDVGVHGNASLRNRNLIDILSIIKEVMHYFSKSINVEAVIDDYEVVAVLSKPC